MGAYIYMLRSPKLVRRVRVEKKDGTTEIVEAGVMSFLFKPYRFTNGDFLFGEKMPAWERLCVAQMKRMENIWARFGQRPKYTVHTYNQDHTKENEMKVGDSVMFWAKDAPIWSWDTPCFEGAESYGTVVELL